MSDEYIAPAAASINKADDDKDKVKQALPGSTQTSATDPNSRVSAFSAGQQTPGSGRFTNIQNYINANKGAGSNLGARANENLNKSFSAGQTDVNKQNTNLQGQFGQGQNTLEAGNLFKKELSGIGSGLNTGFKSIEDKDAFDASGQRAADFAAGGIQNTQGLDTTIGNYQNIAQGKGIDEANLGQLQQQALGSAQGLSQNVNTNLQGVETNQGRDKLFAQAIQPKQGYDPSQRNFDKLFLGGSLNTVRSNLSNQANQANTLVGSTSGQQQTLDQLITDEKGLTDVKTGLYGMAQGNQDTFNTKLGDRANIDLINKLRGDKYDDYLKQLKSGNIGQEAAGDLGLATMQTYNPAQVATPITAGKTIRQPGSTIEGDNSTFIPRDIRAYNADISGKAATYLQRGRDAMGIQDIASDQDYGNYQALQSLAGGRDTGLLKGASTIDRAVSAGKTLDGKTLADTIGGQDADFLKNYAGKKVASMGYGSESGPGSWEGHGAGSQQLDVSTAIGDGSDYGSFRNSNMSRQGGGGSGATSLSVGNIDDYIGSGGGASTRTYDANRNYTSTGGGVTSSAGKLFDVRGNTGSNDQAREKAGNATEAATRAKLNEILNQTGVKNQAHLVQDDPANKTLTRAKRLGRLV